MKSNNAMYRDKSAIVWGILLCTGWGGRASSDKATFDQRPKQSRYVAEEPSRKHPCAKALRQESTRHVLGSVRKK